MRPPCRVASNVDVPPGLEQGGILIFSTCGTTTGDTRIAVLSKQADGAWTCAG